MDLPHARIPWLTELADLSGLTGGLSVALARAPQRRHHPGTQAGPDVLHSGPEEFRVCAILSSAWVQGAPTPLAEIPQAGSQRASSPCGRGSQVQ